MKKIIVVLLLAVSVITVLTGCMSFDKAGDIIDSVIKNSESEADENSEVKKLKGSLKEVAKKSAKTYFDKEIEFSQFDMNYSIVEENEDNDTLEFSNIITLDGKETIILIGHYSKGKPKDIISFILKYDLANEEIVEFGVETIADGEMVYADLNDNIDKNSDRE